MYIPGRGRGFRCCDRGKRCNCGRAIEVDMPAFRQRLATLAPDDADLAKLHISDLYLAFACSRVMPAHSPRSRLRICAKLTGPLRKMGFDSAAIDETLQIVRDELLVAPLGKTPSILGYSGRGALKGWLRSVAARTAPPRSQATRTPRRVRRGLHTSPDDDLELAYMKKTYGAAFERACAKALAALPVEDRLLLKQRFGHRLGSSSSASSMASTPARSRGASPPCESGSSRHP